MVFGAKQIEQTKLYADETWQKNTFAHDWT